MKSPGVLLFSAPLCFSGYGVIRLFGLADGHYGPGIDWQAAHIVGLIGMVLFVPAVLGLERMLPQSKWRMGTVIVTLIGLAATIVQFGADIAFAALAADKADMSRLSREFSAVPGVRLAFYEVGPPLFFAGLIGLTVLLVRAGRLPWWSPVVLAVSAMTPMLTLDLIPLAGLGILASVVGLRRPAERFEASSPALRAST
ncbi:hypothetical protein F3087_12450 [Nocardia colli]|uniref:DUF4386 family protein n=1 Tax=Nocardia colli TaxID=2545717 RepID=A0A5N0EKI4_9NOCA|nr:hypothetical protein [Nocardia colli]KAA8887901.1 hypothetical protein F3087_12450 [Nocardia colli]